METINSIYGWTMFLTALALPQFLGILVHFRIRRFPRLASLIGFIVTTISTLFLLAAYYSSFEGVKKNDSGMESFLLFISVLFIIPKPMFVSFVAQFVFYGLFRTKSVNSSSLNW